MKSILALSFLICSAGEDKTLVNSIPDKVAILNYVEADNLRIFPLTFSGTAKSFISLKDALDKGLVVVQEKNEGEVNTVMLKNKGTSAVFAMAGEVVLGAKQDRMIENDIIIPPNSGWIEVSVYCTEHGRWSGSSKEFASADINVSPSVRANARQNKDQGQVWSEVAKNQEKVMGENSETGAFRDIYDSKSYQGDRDKYFKKFENLVENNTSIKGVIVCVGSDVLCIDLFSSNSMFEEYWYKLLDSYIVEAMGGDDDGSVSLEEAKDFLKEFDDVAVKDEYSPGSGDLYELDSGETQGSAVLSGGALVHTDLFPQVQVVPYYER